MALKRWIESEAGAQLKRHWRTALAAPSLLLVAASCVPANAGQAPIAAAGFVIPIVDVEVAAASADGAPLPPDAAPVTGLQALLGDRAFAANAALPLSELPNPAASPFIVRGRTGLDQLRSLDCLAQAIYYEAASESEAGQRAVAQVVLNRVRHPSWPNSVCGVVYQGPMRPGGGCQFTFTCDGSLARRPGGDSWLRARRLAAEALAGATYAPVGHSTHYHTSQVFPAWAPRLAKTTVIGAHIFYRLPGTWGGPAAFRQAYAGREPMPRPAAIMRAPSLVPAGPPIAPATGFGGYGPQPTRAAPVLEVSEIEAALPQPQIREQYRNSGMWRADSPVAPPAGR
jgi:hypothetical protein